MNYECVICLEYCKKPVSCLRCEKIICKHHVKRIDHKCPHCRLSPFQFKEQAMIQSYIELEIKKKRDKMKEQNIFKCLVQGCNFEGRYHAMGKHRRSKHFDQKIDEILFPEERQKKLKRDALKKFLQNRFEQKLKLQTQQALIIYIKSKGKAQYKKILEMVKHIDICHNKECNRICLGQDLLFIGYDDKKMTGCYQGAHLLDLF